MLGTDFELFCVHSQTKELLPSDIFGLADKFGIHDALMDDNEELCGRIHKDNVMVEVCPLPAETGEELCNNIGRSLAAAQEFLVSRVPEMEISRATNILLPEHYLAMFPSCEEIGCEPDFYLQSETRELGERKPFHHEQLEHQRFAGGHVHISYDNTDIKPHIAAGICELIVGLPYRAMFGLNTARCNFYGSRALHRPTKYPNGARGVEYRVLDNVWTINENAREYVCNDMEIVQHILSREHEAIARMLQGMPAYWDDLHFECLGYAGHSAIGHTIEAVAKLLDGGPGFIQGWSGLKYLGEVPSPSKKSKRTTLLEEAADNEGLRDALAQFRAAVAQEPRRNRPQQERERVVQWNIAPTPDLLIEDNDEDFEFEEE